MCSSDLAAEVGHGSGGGARGRELGRPDASTAGRFCGIGRQRGGGELGIEPGKRKSRCGSGWGEASHGREREVKEEKKEVKREGEKKKRRGENRKEEVEGHARENEKERKGGCKMQG